MIQESSIIVVKSKAFAVRIVNLYKHLIYDKKEYVLSQQVLKCGTRIGADIHTVVCGQGTTDFTAKMRNALQEASETEYWLELLRDTNYLTKEEAESILKDCVELIKILLSITKIVTPAKDSAPIIKNIKPASDSTSIGKNVKPINDSTSIGRSVKSMSDSVFHIPHRR